MASPDVHPLLATLSKQHPDLEVITPLSSKWSGIRATYIADNPAIPLAIARPKSADEVAIIVSAARAHGVKLCVRSGGHDVFGRSMVDGALVIDMRSINSINLSEDQTTVTVGGGVLNGDLIKELSAQGLVTPFGYFPSIGYAGWAMMGGYGWLAPSLGLGVDQIVEAKIVNWQGEILQADEELLKGIRGAGGNFGVAVELEVKVYEMKSFLAGSIMFQSTSIKETLVEFFRGYRALEKSPYGQVSPFMFPHPELSWVFTVNFAWSSPDMEAGRRYLDKIRSLRHPTMDTVKEMKASEWIEYFVPLSPTTAYGYEGDNAISFEILSDPTVEIIAKHMEQTPADPANVFLIHELRGASAEPTTESCFGSRRPHFVLELVGVATDKNHTEASRQWTRAMFEELKGSAEAMEATYVSMTQTKDTDVSKCFGADWQFVLDLKRKYDPEGVFDEAVPRLKR